MPLATRRGGTSSVGATSAWTSTSSGREPSIAQRIAEPGRAGRLGHEAGRGVLDLDQSLVAHLEDARLVGRAEAVLERAQRAVGPLALALERQHAVDEVLEHARAGERALLRHVADEHDRDAAGLRDAHQAAGDLADLPDRAGRAGQPGGVQHLDRVDDADVGPLGLDRRDDGVEIGLGDDRHRERRRPEPLGAQPDLGRRLLAGDVEVARPPAARLPSADVTIVDLPIPGEPPSRTSEPGTSPPPSTRSSSPMPVRSRATRGASTWLSGTGVSARPRPPPPPRRVPQPAAPASPPRPASPTPRSPDSGRATWRPHGRTPSRRGCVVARAIRPT